MSACKQFFPFILKQCLSIGEISKCPGPQAQPRITMGLLPHAKRHLQRIYSSGRSEISDET